MTCTPTDSKVVAIILSGGAGIRFGGTDKGLQLYNDKALIKHVISAIRPQVSELLICINRNENDYSKFGYTLVFDEAPDYQGPLAGVSAAYHWLKSNQHSYDYVLISSCDTPNLPSDYVAALIAALEQSGDRCAVVNDGKRKQNLHCLISYAALPDLVNFFSEGGRAMHRWHQQKGLTEVDFSDQAECFGNFNFSEQLTDS